MTISVTVRVPAKINLQLAVGPLRPDGYHDLVTVFHAVSLSDEVTVAAVGNASAGGSDNGNASGAKDTDSDADNVVVSGEGASEVPADDDNLALRAVRALRAKTGIPGAVRVSISKSIPVAAGMAGGSADAAGALVACDELWGTGLSAAELSAVAAQLGSDVPFFLQGGTALGLGRGEEIYPLPSQKVRYALVVSPGVHSSTAEAYRGVSERLTSIPLQNKLQSFQQSLWNYGIRVCMDDNDFEPVVFARHPGLAKIKARLLRAGATAAAMTGSGSSLFGIFPDAATLERAGQSFRREKAFPVSFLNAAQYRKAWYRALRNHISPETIEENLWPPRSVHA